jgi:hypothetical protein
MARREISGFFFDQVGSSQRGGVGLKKGVDKLRLQEREEADGGELLSAGSFFGVRVCVFLVQRKTKESHASKMMMGL